VISLEDSKEVIVRKAEKAPFFGVLVPEHTYRWYQKKVSESEILKSKVEVCSNEVAGHDERNSEPILVYTLGGAAIGFSAGLLVYALVANFSY